MHDSLSTLDKLAKALGLYADTAVTVANRILIGGFEGDQPED